MRVADLLDRFLKLCCFFRSVVVLGLIESWPVFGIDGSQLCPDLLLSPLGIISNNACSKEFSIFFPPLVCR